MHVCMYVCMWCGQPAIHTPHSHAPHTHMHTHTRSHTHHKPARIPPCSSSKTALLGSSNQCPNQVGFQPQLRKAPRIPGCPFHHQPDRHTGCHWTSTWLVIDYSFLVRMFQRMALFFPMQTSAEVKHAHGQLTNAWALIRASLQPTTPTQYLLCLGRYCSQVL